MERVDAIVVGQGLAGTTLAWQLLRRGRRVLVLDREEASTSSLIAAGLITPVTGKRLAKSWRWDELYPAAVAFYRSVERETGEMLFHQRPSIRLFVSEAEVEEYRRRAPSVIAGLVRETTINDNWFAAPFGGFEMPHAARLDVPRYLNMSRQMLQEQRSYRVVEFDPAKDIELVDGLVRLTRFNVEAPAIIFCRGFVVDPDPWFGEIRFTAAKGEILTLRVPGLVEERVIHRGVWLAPMGNDRFRAGSTYEWDDLNSTPTPEARAAIESRLRAFLRLPFEVIDHRAAVRPVIDAGFPLLGRHPRCPQLAYFNGLGSKGSLLAPFFADQLVADLAGEREVDREVDVRKFLRT